MTTTAITPATEVALPQSPRVMNALSANPRGYWSGKVALITGSSRGLGRSLAEAFAKAGAKVVISARSASDLNTVADEMRQAGGEVLAIPADVTQQDQVDALVNQTVGHFGRLDVLVNNVGQSTRGVLLDTTPDDFARLMEINFLSVVRCTRAAVPHLIRSRGHLVNIGSLSGKSASRYVGAYSATKFALAAYTQQLRMELRSQGVHVMLVSPGPIGARRCRPPLRRSNDRPAGQRRQARRGAKISAHQTGKTLRRHPASLPPPQAGVDLPRLGAGVHRVDSAVPKLWRLADAEDDLKPVSQRFNCRLRWKLLPHLFANVVLDRRQAAHADHAERFEQAKSLQQIGRRGQHGFGVWPLKASTRMPTKPFTVGASGATSA